MSAGIPVTRNLYFIMLSSIHIQTMIIVAAASANYQYIQTLVYSVGPAANQDCHSIQDSRPSHVSDSGKESRICYQKCGLSVLRFRKSKQPWIKIASTTNRNSQSQPLYIQPMQQLELEKLRRQQRFNPAFIIFPRLMFMILLRNLTQCRNLWFLFLQRHLQKYTLCKPALVITG